MVVLNRIEDIPSMMIVTKLLASAPRQLSPQPPPSPDDVSNVLQIHCLRLMELTQRTSAVMKVSERHFDKLDPVINVFRTFGKLNEVIVTAKMAIVPDDSFADSVYYQTLNSHPEMVIVPWSVNAVPAVGTPSAIPHDQFIKSILDKVECHVAVVIDTQLVLEDEYPLEPSLSRSISMTSLRNKVTAPQISEDEVSPSQQLHEGYHVFLPYFGGRDDRIALNLVAQLLHCPDVKVTVVRIAIEKSCEPSSVAMPAAAHTATSENDSPNTQVLNTPKSPLSIVSTISEKMSKVVHLSGQHAPSNAPQSSNEEPIDDDGHFKFLLASIPADIKSRLNIENITTSTPLEYAVQRAKHEINSKATLCHLVVVGRGLKHSRAANVAAILRKNVKDVAKGPINEAVGKSCLGDVGEAMLLGHVTGEILVVQGSAHMDDRF